MGRYIPSSWQAQWAPESDWGSTPAGMAELLQTEGFGDGLRGTGGRQRQDGHDHGWVLNFPDLGACIESLVSRWCKDYQAFSEVNNAVSRDAAACKLKAQVYATDPGIIPRS